MLPKKIQKIFDDNAPKIKSFLEEYGTLLGLVLIIYYLRKIYKGN